MLASSIQLATAASFLCIAVSARFYGSRAQAAAEADVVRQGYRARLLVEARVRFVESTIELTLPLLIGAIVGTLGVLNLMGSAPSRTMTWVVQTVLLLAGGFITLQQVFASRFVRSAFLKSRDESLHRIDVDSFMREAAAAFPTWFRPLVVVRFGLVTLGSLLVMVLLAMPAAQSHFG
jgi:hypothetical protein